MKADEESSCPEPMNWNFQTLANVTDTSHNVARWYTEHMQERSTFSAVAVLRLRPTANSVSHLDTSEPIHGPSLLKVLDSVSVCRACTSAKLTDFIICSFLAIALGLPFLQLYIASIFVSSTSYMLIISIRSKRVCVRDKRPGKGHVGRRRSSVVGFRNSKIGSGWADDAWEAFRQWPTSGVFVLRARIGAAQAATSSRAVRPRAASSRKGCAFKRKP